MDYIQIDLMMQILTWFVLIIYFISLCVVTVYSLNQLFLLITYYFSKKSPSINPNGRVLPNVTVQLPLFNEQYVTERLIAKIMELDYPKDKLQVQVLDDSTDQTVEIATASVAKYKHQGFDIELIHRTDRSGFKAGALKEAMPKVKGDFIAIFDADFLPNADFLLKTLTAFDDPSIGVVQTRWSHLNQHHSLLTELQAVQLNVHFTIEQAGRYYGDYLLQFNGTAGMWRKETIDDAGGWESDTLTEDLDLSYRAQLKGWKIAFQEDITAPAELPIEINGLKSQQYRWMKGGAQSAKKLLGEVWRSSSSFGTKVQATFHLLASSVFVFILTLTLLSVPVPYMIKKMGINTDHFSVFLVGFFAFFLVSFVANVGVAWPKENKVLMLLKFVLLFPYFMSVSMAMALHNVMAVVSGYMGTDSAFVRTPKYGFAASREKKKSYFSRKLSGQSIIEGLLGCYFAYAVFSDIGKANPSFNSMHLMLAFGYFTLFGYALQSKFSKG